MKVEGYAAMNPGEKLVPFTYELGGCKEDEVEVEVSYCGICHSDIHLIDNDWKVSKYPLVPGHEVIGTIASAGADVTNLKPGQRVGIGWQCTSCLHCDFCLRGEENLCLEAHGTAVGHFGGFASRVRAQERFVIPIPDDLPSASCGPLLCGGITAYSPLHVGQVTPNQHIAILGIGGLGHLALQFYRAFGCEVTALSTSQDKDEEARRLGAHHFINIEDPKQLKPASFDLIISTTPVSVDYSLYFSLLKPKGKFCLLGVSPEISLNAMWFISGNKQMFGSSIGNPLAIKEMLNFAARHQILPQVEVFPLSKVNEAIEKVRTNKIRYRAVLEILAKDVR